MKEFNLHWNIFSGRILIPILFKNSQPGIPDIMASNKDSDPRIFIELLAWGFNDHNTIKAFIGKKYILHVCMYTLHNAYILNTHIIWIL